MGFDINQKRDAEYRHTFAARDYDYLRNCKTCPLKELCGGWSVWNDARWCVGPGEVCVGGESGKWVHGCRAICSRSPEKVSYLATLLGQDHCFLNPEYNPESPDVWKRVQYLPRLSIVGEHPWVSWEYDWPDVGFQVNAHVEGIYQDLYTISLKHLYYPDRDSWSPQKDVRKRFQIPKDSAVAITTTTHDFHLDRLCEDLDLWADEMVEFEGVDFIIAPNLSVYDNYPRLDNLFQIKRKWIMLEKLQRRGALVLPDVCFVTSGDFKNQVAWMRDNHCTCMMMNFQVQAVTTTTPQWRAQLKNALMVRDFLGWPVQMLAYGATGGDRMVEIAKHYPTTTFLDAKSFRLAEFHHDLFGGTDKTKLVKVQFRENCAAMIERVRKAKKGFALGDDLCDNATNGEDE